MKNRIEIILRERKRLGYTWDKLSEGLPIAGNSLRVAFSRNSVDEVYLEHVESVLGLSKNVQNLTEERTVALKEDGLYIEKQGVKVGLDEIALFAAEHIDALKKKKVFYNTFVVEAIALIKHAQKGDGTIDVTKLISKDD